MLELNGQKWEWREDFKYRWNYEELFQKAERWELPGCEIIKDPKFKGPKDPKVHLTRQLLQDDLWFLIRFGLQIPIVEHPFVIQACRDVGDGPKSNTVDLWAREHFKSTIITIADTLRTIFNNPEDRVAIFSYSKPAALRFLRVIKWVMETSEFLKFHFPDILWADPATQAPKWSEDLGLICQRKGNWKEPTVAAFGLIEGMPTGDHFSKRVYDDIETPDMAFTPEMIQKLIEAFDISQNLGTMDGAQRIIGTPYHHEGLLTYLAEKKAEGGTPLYHVRKKPATHNGEANGVSVFLPEARLAELRTTKHFFSQQLLDPTPKGEMKLDPNWLTEVFTSQIPDKLCKFMLVDPAGQRKDRVGDSWAIVCVGVEPFRDDLGASTLYLLDMIVEPMSQADAMEAIVNMYTRNGRILKLGIEKVGLSTMEIHAANALRAKGRIVSEEAGNLVKLTPAGRRKEDRIEAALGWPLRNGKIRVSAGIPVAYRDRLRMEMRKFPFWHDDCLDAIAYAYDVLRDYRFGPRDFSTNQPEDKWSRAREKRGGLEHGWMVV